MFQVEQRLAVDYRFQPLKCWGADDDLLADSQVGQAPRERLAMRHRFVGSNAPGDAPPTMFARMKGTSREGLRMLTVRDDASQSLFSFSESGYIRIEDGMQELVNMAIRVDFCPRVLEDLLVLLESWAGPSDENISKAKTIVVPAAE